MHPSLLLLPHARQAGAVSSFPAPSLLSLALSCLPSLGDHSCVHGLKGPIQGWLPAQASSFHSRLPHLIFLTRHRPLDVPKALQNQHVSSEMCDFILSPTYIHTHTCTHAMHSQVLLQQSKDCDLYFISNVQYSVWDRTGAQTSCVKALGTHHMELISLYHGPSVLSTLLCFRKPVFPIEPWASRGQVCSPGSHMLPVTSRSSGTISKCICYQSFGLCPVSSYKWSKNFFPFFFKL